MIEPLVWNPLPLALAMAFDGVVWAPLFEEIGFRGLLYVTLRTRLRPWPAIVVTALMFAAIHPYSIVGFLILSLSAALWAWSYEKTGSLLPAMLTHFAGNLLAIAAMMLAYR